MRGIAVAWLALAVASCTAQDTLSVAIIDYEDTWTGTKGLGLLLDDLGQSYTDITSDVIDGDPIDLADCNTFVIGAFCTQHGTIRSVLADAGPTMNQFVAAGGTVIMLTQADQNRAREDWIEPPAVITRGDSDFDLIRRVQPAHQLFNSPNSIIDTDLQGWLYYGDAGTWPTAWESFHTFEQVGVLAGDAPVIVHLATVIEAGWGTGRVLFLALAPDKARNIGNAQARAQAPRLMQNLLQYAQDVLDGTVEDIIVYQGGGYPDPITGRVFEDLDDDGEWEPGEPGISGVGVSDTIDLVLTDTDGVYTLPNDAGDASLLYICLPSGYAKSATWYRQINVASPPSDFEFALTASDESGPFEFVQISDIHVGGSGTKDLLIDALAQIGAITNPPELILATGDLVDSGSAITQYEDYVVAIDTSMVPCRSVFGNHDANSGGVSNFRHYLGPDYYSFDYADCHFLIVNSVYKTSTQSNWIAQDLALLLGDKKLFIFQHYSPSASEHAQFASYGTRAVFSGHWHSQHTVAVDEMASYNSSPLLFGGIDCSPAGFKVISVVGDDVTTRMKWMADGRHLQIVTPSESQIIPDADLMVIVNAYETSAEVVSVSYEVKRGSDVVATGSLQQEGNWSWVGTVPQAQLRVGSYELSIEAVNDKNETHTAQSSFTKTGVMRPEASAPTPWRQFGGGPQRGGNADATIRPPLGPVWVADTAGTIDFASPVVDGDTLYLGVKDRRDFSNNGVIALEVSDGSLQWFASTPAAVSHSAAVDDEHVYACSYGGILHGFERDTALEAWQQVLGSPVQRWLYGAPLVDGEAVYAGTYEYFGRFHPADGTESWHRSYGGDWISCNASPATDGTLVIVPANWATNSLRAVNPDTGATVWQYTVSGLHGSPVIAAGSVVFTDWDGYLHCVRLSDGQRLWRRTLGGGRSATTPAVFGNIVVAAGTGSIRAFRLADGLQLWSFATTASPLKMAPYNNGFAALVGSPTIVADAVYVPCGDGNLYVLDLATGEQEWSMSFGVPILSAPCISGDFLFLSTFDGHIYAFAGQDAFVLPGDLNGDGCVNHADLGILLSDWGCTGGECPGDCDFDGDTDHADLGLLLGHWGEGCP